ncbi:DUF4142 domain-containing protein [Rufibacter sp. LB8]|uniref:DUF4142 domain-containing protein n=1 Tax=Rufibacter sp. LB8 TaxID=2777781 RepID=UPI00178C4D36|nr:DUF4142 domain-containing protein [Rufibacter sp. LB8]
MKKGMLCTAAGLLFAGFGCTKTETAVVSQANKASYTVSASVGGAAMEAGPMSVTGETTASNSNTLTDAAFLAASASSNLLEIELGTLAAKLASNQEVKRFAQMMVEHHTKASEEQKTMAAQLNIALPSTMLPEHQALADKLKGKTGKDFDVSYMDLMETVHKQDIALFEAKSKSAESPVVKVFAAKTLLMLQSHYMAATRIEDKVD